MCNNLYVKLQYLWRLYPGPRMIMGLCGATWNRCLESSPNESMCCCSFWEKAFKPLTSVSSPELLSKWTLPSETNSYSVNTQPAFICRALCPRFLRLLLLSGYWLFLCPLVTCDLWPFTSSSSVCFGAPQVLQPELGPLPISAVTVAVGQVVLQH